MIFQKNRLNKMHTITKNEKKNHSKYDIGLGILRPFLCFLVIISHCYNPRNADGIWKDIFFKTEGCYIHVKTFFIISLYFSYNTLISSNISKKIAKLERLLIPYFIWPLIYFFANKLIIKFILVKDHQILEFKDMKYQLLLGHGFVNPFWFQLNLIFIFIIFALIILLFKKSYNYILLLLGITSFLLQYNGKNFLYFDSYPEEIKFSLGRLIEMIPPSVTGFLLASFQVIIILKKYRYRTIFVCVYIVYFLVNFRIFIFIPGFWNQGLRLYFVSICIFIIFSMFPSEKIKNERIINIIRQIANHTAGIYYIHIPVYRYTREYIMFIHINSIKGCAIIYLISYLICFVGNKIFGKTKIRNLFE